MIQIFKGPKKSHHSHVPDHTECGAEDFIGTLKQEAEGYCDEQNAKLLQVKLAGID